LLYRLKFLYLRYSSSFFHFQFSTTLKIVIYRYCLFWLI
jgi:hypothetical protein